MSIFFRIFARDILFYAVQHVFYEQEIYIPIAHCVSNNGQLQAFGSRNGSRRNRKN